MLVHYRELFKNNFAGRYAVPAFNTQDLEITLGIVRAAVAKKAPVIVQVSQSTIGYAGLENIERIIASVASDAAVTVPVALHLDHTKEPAAAERAIAAGFSSVMIDGSRLSFAENVSLTKGVVEFAHSQGAWVQGELGRIRGTEDWISVTDIEELFTDPDEAENFVRQTGVDTLAVAVGTIHGILKFTNQAKPKLDVARIQKIKSLVDVPLVLHGASGVGPEELHKAIEAGIQVVNIDTELRLAFSQAVRQVVQDPHVYDPREILTPGIEAIQAVAERKFDELNATGKG